MSGKSHYDPLSKQKIKKKERAVTHSESSIEPKEFIQPFIVNSIPHCFKKIKSKKRGK